MQVTARDTGRLTTETATVVVTVASASGVPRTATTGAAGATHSSAPTRGAAARAAAAAPNTVGVRAAAGEPRTAAALPASVARSIAAARAGAAARADSARRPASASPRGARARAAGAGRRTALADSARTYAGVPVLIDVLENDAKRENMRIVDIAASEGAHREAPPAQHCAASGDQGTERRGGNGRLYSQSVSEPGTGAACPSPPVRLLHNGRSRLPFADPAVVVPQASNPLPSR